MLTRLAWYGRCALDADDSDQLTADEFARFLRRAPVEKKVTLFGGRGGTTADLGKGFSFTTNEAIASQPTKEMRAELEAAGVALPGEMEVLEGR